MDQRPGLADEERDRLVAVTVDMTEDGRRGCERHFVLARSATVDDANAKPPHRLAVVYVTGVTETALFELTACDGRARRGRLLTPHGAVETRRSCRWGPLARLKAVTPRDLEAAGAEIVLATPIICTSGRATSSSPAGADCTASWVGPGPS